MKVGVSRLIKVVLDTNILVSSVFWKKGNPHKVVGLALDKKIKVFTSTEILKELEKVLRRDFKEDEDFIKDQTDLILEYAEVIKTTSKMDVVKDDPDDNKIVGCAVDSKSDYIITGDPHLLKLKEFKGIKIINSREFIEMVKD